MPESGRLRLSDVRAAFRLLGECRELGGDFVAWRRHLLDGLRGLTGAQLALYLQLRDLGTEAEAIAEPLDSGFLDSSHLKLWGHYQQERAHRDDPFHQRYYRQFTGGVLTRRLEAVVDDPVWRRSRHYNDYIRACGLGDRITTSSRLGAPDSGVIQTIVLHRAAADGGYRERSVRLVHLVHEELQFMLGRGLLAAAPPRGEQLPKQLERVLACLLEGDAEKQVADRLSLSRHTVNHHVQRLYRRFDVHTRAELLTRCRNSGPGHATRVKGGGKPGDRS
jgi:DNA-binding CsgD family transcriptional regulator